MKILCLSDFHGRGTLPQIEPDVVVVLGDIDYYELRQIDVAYTCPKIGVLGNHDGPDYFNDTGIMNAHKQVIEINGVTFAGFEGCPVYNQRKYLQYDEAFVEAFMQTLPKVDVFLAHSNPAWEETDDETDPHRGFVAFTTYIETKQPTFFVHGHLHEQSERKVKDTTIFGVYPSVVLTIEN